MLKKASRKNVEVPDVSADDPAHTMVHFTEGLRRVLSAPKVRSTPKRKKKKH